MTGRTQIETEVGKYLLKVFLNKDISHDVLPRGCRKFMTSLKNVDIVWPGSGQRATG